jgi:hypothetical protein
VRPERDQREQTASEQMSSDSERVQVSVNYVYNSPIFEMATMCYLEDDYGIEVEVQSNDHIQLHAHVYDKNKKPVGRFLLFKKIPTSVHEILPYPGDDVSSVKYNIFKWAPANNKPFQKAGITASNWKATIIQWNIFHKDKPVPEAPSTPATSLQNK